MLSYWEKQALLQYDIIIVGSGIVGLSTAVSVKEKNNSKRVLVLERAILPTGASTKNAGFACIGSLTEILDDLQHMSSDEVVRLVTLRHAGLSKLRNRLGDEKIGYTANGSYELISSNNENCLNELDNINRLMENVTGGKSFSVVDEKLPQFGFTKPYAQHLIGNNFEGELHTGKMMRALIDYCIALGVEIKTGCEVVAVEETSSTAKVLVKHQVLNEKIAFTAQQVCICTNAFTKQLFPNIDVTPGRGQVLITEPIAQLPFKGIFHFDKGYYYFREIESRVLFGGGRNLDFENEASTEFAFNEKIQKDLLHKLETVILPGIKFKVADWWTGIMAFGKTKFPVIKRRTQRIVTGVRMGGMGVAIGSEAGDKLAAMLLEN